MVRVLIWDVPHMLREIMTDVLGQEVGIEVVRKRDLEGELADAIQRYLPDVLILSDAADATSADFLESHVRRRIFSVMDEGRNVRLSRLRPEHILLGNISPEELVEAICDATRLPDSRQTGA